ncbi:hypothetical protein OWV82_016429 [Melia azedarach]|uniref:Uncharacterized protein n=1 Tax=Melia azedarach TaxID=155640 RepID=A0ACC1XFX8_MELAZ|nr:hypothetical protein OWV82_016429 [Melia azedarach]
MVILSSRIGSVACIDVNCTNSPVLVFVHPLHVKHFISIKTPMLSYPQLLPKQPSPPTTQFSTVLLILLLDNIRLQISRNLIVITRALHHSVQCSLHACSQTSIHEIAKGLTGSLISVKVFGMQDNDGLIYKHWLEGLLQNSLRNRTAGKF